MPMTFLCKRESQVISAERRFVIDTGLTLALQNGIYDLHSTYPKDKKNSGDCGILALEIMGCIGLKAKLMVC
jgi:hypothetical protein